MHSTTFRIAGHRALFRALWSIGVFSTLTFCLSCGGVENGGTAPTTMFGVVLEAIGRGVVATPSGNTSYVEGTVVSYAFAAQDGRAGVYVTLDSVPAPASGTVTINRNHVFTAVINNQVGSPAPEFTGRTSTGQTVRLSDYRGKMVFVDFSEPPVPGLHVRPSRSSPIRSDNQCGAGDLVPLTVSDRVGGEPPSAQDRGDIGLTRRLLEARA